MPMLVALFASALAAAPPPIINGEAPAEDQFPNTGGLLLSAYIDMGRYGAMQYDGLICSSTLIAPDVVLVAAHCLDPDVLTYGYGTVSDTEYRWSRQADLTDWDGSTRVRQWPEDSVQAWDWVFHEDFDITGLGYGTSVNYDIALVFLDTPVTDVAPAVLITEDEEDQVVEGADVQIVGWGQQEATGAQETPAPGTYAIKMWGDSVIGEVDKAEFQVGPERSMVRKCHGDSGGPTFMEVESDSPVATRQIGVTSHAYDDTDCDKKGGVDTRVSYYREWIDEEMRARCEDGSRAWCDEAGILAPPAPEAPDDDDSDGNGDGNAGDNAGDVDGEDVFAIGCSTGGAPPALGGALGLVPALLLLTRRRR